MSQQYDAQEIRESAEAGRVLAGRLRVARETSGPIVCPTCKLRFDATHVVRCPACRSFIDDTFQAETPGGRPQCRKTTTRKPGKPRKRASRMSRRVEEKVELELDFFTGGYMEYKG